MHRTIDERSRRPRLSAARHRTAGALAGLAIAAGALAYATPTALAAPGSVSGTVYRDANNNGVQDGGEPGIAGIVIAAGSKTTTTNNRGAYRLTAPNGTKVRAIAGWYRSQCDAEDCAAGPGRQQDFAVNDQWIVATAAAGATLDLGLLPDWPGGFPIPTPRTANTVDVSATIDWVGTSGQTGVPCARTALATERACYVDDVASFFVRIYNEGTSSLSNPSARFEMPAGLRLESLNLDGASNPAVTSVGVGAPVGTSGSSQKQAFSLRGTLPPAGVVVLNAKFRVGASTATASTTELTTSAPWPTAVTVSVTDPTNDVEDEPCTESATTCARTADSRQLAPDNADTTGFAVVTATTSATTTIAPTTTAASTTTAAPTTTAATTTTAAPTTTAATTTTIAPTTTAAPMPIASVAPSCTVSALLVPSCGAWLGSSTPSADGTYDFARGLAEYEQVAGSTPDIIHFYKSNAASFPTAKEIEQSERPGKQRSLMLYNWKPSSSLTWRQIANGAADANIATVANGLKRYPHQLFLAIHHEPENDVVDTPTSGMNPDDYAAMFRHVVTKLRGAGVTNAVFVVNYMGFTAWSTIVDRLYPGDAYVDWISYDPYAHAAETAFAKLLDRPKASANWPGFYSWATAKAPGKPIMLSEWGFDLQNNAASPDIIVTGPDVLEAQFPMIKALVYWNSFTAEYTYRIDQPTALGRAYGQAFATFAADEYFARTSTAKAL